MEPFLKWVGGKRDLLDQIPIPAFTGRYFEPFLGSGALFFSLPPQKRPWLSDANVALIRCYEGLRDFPEEFIEELLQLPKDKEAYLRIREEPVTPARFYYLNRVGFRGLYRVNKRGQFNTPYGSGGPKEWDVQRLREASAALRGAILTPASFEHSLTFARPGDFVYCDPPYFGTFDAYTPTKFGYEEHVRLAKAVSTLVAKGVHVLVSNSDTPETREMYQNLEIRKIKGSQKISSYTKGPTKEILVVGVP